MYSTKRDENNFNKHKCVYGILMTHNYHINNNVTTALCVCVSACICACMCMCAHACMRMCAHARVHAWTCACM